MMGTIEVRVGDLGEVVTGKTPSKKEAKYFDGEFQFVTPSDLSFKHYYCRKTEVTVTEEAKSKHKNQFVPAESVMFTCIGNTIGKCAISSELCLTNQQINTIVPGDENESKFIYYFLNHYMEVFRGIGLSGGAATPIINKTSFSSVKLKAPYREKWPEIGRLLSAYDDLIENNRRRIQLLEESARLLYKEWFVHLRFPGHEHVKIKDGVPEGWSEGIVSDFYNTASGGTPSRKNLDFYTGDISWIKTGELKDGFIVNSEEKITEEAIKNSSAKLFPVHTVLVAMYGATIGQTGILAVESASNQACCALMPKEKIANYIYAYLFLRENKAGLIGRSKGAAQNNISQDIVKSFKMIMPSGIIMSLFFDNLSPVFCQLLALQQQNIKLEKARDILLPRLMSGGLAV
ncbi:restriction endonuclease subunit S [Alcanivorax sp. S6407]|uniref:restriction endonuclease subunit S n=1 Tax=Alcanivorax sp. S6407 TaxID=2926424 RepID=UPI001FF551D6|nr:restriction endonuclease subunit S [Alcanivorax sp. S6407]MCK0154614.1 restriction endonuclease subunit S [Alcanivorax sp. S6407]